MPDPRYGERMCAFVVLAQRVDTIDVPQIARHLDALGVAKFKYPERIEVVESFPATSGGKPSKPLMRELIARKLEAEGRQKAATG